MSSGADPRRAALDARVREWIDEWRRGAAEASDDARFESLALDLFAFQAEHCAPYRRFCAWRGIAPREVRRIDEIPPVPAGAFKELPLRSFEATRTTHVFRTSGTSGERRGELLLDTLALYEASVVPNFVHFVLPEASTALADASVPDRPHPFVLRALVPAPRELPDSSLSHMFGVLLRELGSLGIVDPKQSGFDVRDGRLDADGLLAALSRAEARTAPVALCGTAFAFVHLCDALAARGVRLALPAGSRVMETGGFKGRSRELSRETLWARIEERLGISSERVVNQYGMTELASQFHDSVLRFPKQPRRKLGPPWTRTRVVDPITGRDVAPGEVGAVVLLDLANTGSVLAVQTADLGRAAGDGFEVLGREPGAEARGCSIAADVMLAPDVA